VQKKIGELLQERRQAMGASLADVEGATLIRSAYLEAIEKGDYGAIPGEIYLKLYVKSYASFLGMDPQQAASMLEKEMAEAQSEEPKQPVLPPSETSMDKRMLHRIRMEQKRRQAARRRTLTTALAIFLLAAVVLVAYIAFGGLLGKDEAIPGETAPAQGAQTAHETQEAPAVTAETEVQEAPALPKSQHTLRISFSDNCWIRAYADGKKAFEGILKAGDSLDLSGDKGIWVRIGNAGATSLNYNGEDLGVPGVARKAMDIAFPAGYGPF